MSCTFSTYKVKAEKIPRHHQYISPGSVCVLPASVANSLCYLVCPPPNVSSVFFCLFFSLLFAFCFLPVCFLDLIFCVGFYFCPFWNCLAIWTDYQFSFCKPLFHSNKYYGTGLLIVFGSNLFQCSWHQTVSMCTCTTKYPHVYKLFHGFNQLLKLYLQLIFLTSSKIKISLCFQLVKE